MKDSYIMHCDYDDHFKILTNAELGQLIRDVNNYVKNGVLPQYTEKDRVLNMAFSFMKTNIDIETEKYLDKCEKNKQNGRRGGRPRKTKKPNGFDENPTKANTDTETETDTDTDTETDTDTDTDNSNVCNNSACANSSFCHLGSMYKTEQCFYCMKKNKCPNEDSPTFEFDHPNETFEAWDKRKTEEMKNIIESKKARGQPVNMEMFDYDWLNEK